MPSLIVSLTNERIVRSNGRPFATEKSAILSMRCRKLRDHEPVPVTGGWALQRVHEPTSIVVS